MGDARASDGTLRLLRTIADGTQGGTERNNCYDIDGKKHDMWQYLMYKRYEYYDPQQMRDLTNAEKGLGMTTWNIPWKMWDDKMNFGDLSIQEKVDKFAANDKWVTLPLAGKTNRQQPRTSANSDMIRWQNYMWSKNDKNFYNSVWGGSTASGEYANMTGNFYTTANCLKASGSKYEPLVLGNQFKKIGYTTLAYHNNSYTYYGRNKSHPNFGYKWIATGNGLKLEYNGWPRSDKEMAEVTVKDYIGLDHPFHAYYMSVSGHANYTFSGNSMSSRHRKDLPESLRSKSEGVQAFNACQYEVELMLKALVDALDEAGELEDTVFAMAADHYPYALSDGDLASLYGIPKDNIRNNFDLYRNGFILWSAYSARKNRRAVMFGHFVVRLVERDFVSAV